MFRNSVRRYKLSLCVAEGSFRFSCILEWKYYLQAGSLYIYQLTTTEIGIVTELSLTIRDNFSWLLSCHNHQVHAQQCSLLENTPSLLNSGKSSCHCGIIS